MMIAALQSESVSENDHLLDAAKKLCNAFSDFLKYVEPDCSEVTFLCFIFLCGFLFLTPLFLFFLVKKPRQNLFSAVGKIGEAGNEVIRNINRGENLSDSQEPKLQVNDV